MSNSSHSVKIVTHNLELGHKSSFNFEMKFAICAVCIWKRRGRYGTCYRVSGEHRWHYENVSLFFSYLSFSSSFFCVPPTLLCPPYSLLPHIFFSPLSPFLLLPTLNLLSSSLLNIRPSSSPFPLLSSLLFPLFPSPSIPFFFSSRRRKQGIVFSDLQMKKGEEWRGARRRWLSFIHDQGS